MKRTHPLISKNKIVNAINLFESKIDATIESISMEGQFINKNLFYITTKTQKKYGVDIARNVVELVYPDYED